MSEHSTWSELKTKMIEQRNRRIAQLQAELAEAQSYRLNYEHATKVEREELQAKLAAMIIDRNLWQDAHNEECPNLAALKEANATIERMKAPVSDPEWTGVLVRSDLTQRQAYNALIAARAAPPADAQERKDAE